MNDLRAQMESPNRRERKAAVAELIRRGGDDAVELLGLALDDPVRIVRYKALEGLGTVGGPTALALLLARMDDESESTFMRRAAVDAIAKMNTPEAADALEARLETIRSRRGRKLMARWIDGIRRSTNGR